MKHSPASVIRNGVDETTYRKYRVPSGELLLQMVEILAQERGGFTQSELMQRLGVSKAVIFRMCITLLYHQYIERHPITHRLALTRRVLALGNSAICEHNLIEEALPIMRRLRDLTGETVQIGTQFDAEGIVLNQIPSTQAIRIVVDPGTRFGLHCTAPGKAILAYLPEAELEKTLKAMTFPRHSASTITDRKKFRQELEKVKKVGYAVDLAEGVIAGLHCVSCPIFDEAGYPVGALTVLGPSMRMAEAHFSSVAEHLRPLASELSAKLGFGSVQPSS